MRPEFSPTRQTLSEGVEERWVLMGLPSVSLFCFKCLSMSSTLCKWVPVGPAGAGAGLLPDLPSSAIPTSGKVLRDSDTFAVV